jgi:predicted phage terminase large subunit-like protein
MNQLEEVADLLTIEDSQLLAELCRKSFFEFVKEFWETIIAEDPVWNWHIEYLCNELQQIAIRIKNRQPKLYDLIINIPPGTSKSTIVSQMFPAWCWTIDPTIRIIGSSHSKTLSIDQAEKCRMIIQSDKYQQYFPGIEILHTTEAKSHFKNNSNGERYATSTGESKIGIHGHLIIVDDPLNPKQADSEPQRLEANKHITQTLSTRKVDKQVAVTIIIMQRLHEDDPTGYMLKRRPESIKHICLPAEVSNRVKPAELKEHYVEGLMDPNRMNAEVLQEAKDNLGSYGYAGQFKQEPADAEGGILKRSWFGRFKIEQLIERARELKVVPTFQYFIDGAYTEDTANDATGIKCACKVGNFAYILDVSVVRKQFPDLIAYIPKFVEKNGFEAHSKIYVEPKATGISIVQQIQANTTLTIVKDEPPKDSKVVRCHAISPFVEGGRVLLLDGAPWVESYLDEVCTFPKAAHDERVDLLTMMCRRFFVSNNSFKGSYTV